MKPKGSQFHQLPMFMRAGDLANNQKVVHPEESEYAESDGMSTGEFQAMKVRESQAPGSSVDTYEPDNLPGTPSLHSSIEQGGVRKPVHMSLEAGLDDIDGDGPRHLTLNDGHHRVFTANSINPNMEVPVSFDNGLGWVNTGRGRDLTRDVDQKDPWAQDPRKS